MGMDLQGRQGYFRFSMDGWHSVLNVAKKYGWEPQGTDAPTTDVEAEHEWDGNYSSNSNQAVTSSDAEQISVALSRALAANDLEPTDEAWPLSDEITQTRRLFLAICEDMGGKPLNMPGDGRKLEYDKVKDFAEYTSLGGFTIG
jgi:hypothetical protein